ncbi:MAG: hypothetical protein LBT97_12955 [Planctomycetota bacterium]|jgi:hypothetical protein|nr:hypothetical protein [Planctomycetota bacterium]
MNYAYERRVSRLFRWLCAFALVLAWGAARAGDKDLPIERMIGGKLVADVDQALEGNGVSSVAVIGFFSTDSNQILASGINGALPNELNRILSSGLTNQLRNGRNKYRVMSASMISKRKKAAGLNADNIDTASTVGKILEGSPAKGDERFDAMLYGMIRKKGGPNERMVEINLWLARLSGDSVVRIALNYDYRLDSGPGDKRSLVFLGENFPPLFVSRPGKPRVNNPSGLFGGNSEVKVYIRVDGKRLPFFHASDPVGENQAVVKIPGGAEYDIEIFDRLGSRRADARLLAAVMVDGIGTIGAWEMGDGGPEEDIFMLADNPAEVGKWMLNGKGVDSRDDAGNPGKSYIIRGWQVNKSVGRKFVFQEGASSLAALSGQLSPKLGVVTAVFYAEGPTSRGDYGTGMGQEFSSQVQVIEARFDPDPKYVVNIRCVAADAGDDPAEDEGLTLVTG